MGRLSTDRGRTADRIATIVPSELHGAIATAAIAALRAGAPLECLDGLEYFHLRSTGFGTRNSTDQRRDLLTAQIQRHRAIADQARKNANSATTTRLRDEFLTDAENAHAELAALELELESLDEDQEAGVIPSQFSTEVDFIAHALAKLAGTTTTSSAEFGEAINQVVTGLRITPQATTRTCDVEFHILLPADGMVLRFGPVRTSVTNRAYLGTLPNDVRPDAPRLILTREASAHDMMHASAQSDHEVLQEVRRTLVEKGFTDLAAGTIVRSDFTPLFAIIANSLWGTPLDTEYDPDYVALVLSTYRDPRFRWDPHRHMVDASLRQQLVDAVAFRGGHVPLPELIGSLAHTKLTDQRIAAFGRVQQLGEAPPWEPCVERVGNWAQKAPRHSRSIRLWRCPHCGANATKVVRAPEVAACILCPTCRRMPTADSPQFPHDYFAQTPPVAR